MTPKQEKFLIAKYKELSFTVNHLNQKQKHIELFLVNRAGYKPPPVEMPGGAPPLGGALQASEKGAIAPA